MAIGATIGGIAALIALLSGGSYAGVASGNTNKKTKEAIAKIRSSNPELYRGASDQEIMNELEFFRDPTTTAWYEAILPKRLDSDYYSSGLQGVLDQIAEAERISPQLNQIAPLLDVSKERGNIQDMLINDRNVLLGDIQGTYDTYRKDMLQQQNLNRGQIMNAYQNTFRDQRTRAIEAGASAGLKLANNVNALLSAQNTQRATSLETSNQLANMALQQQNAALSVRDKYSGANLENQTSNILNNRFGENQLIRNTDIERNEDILAGSGLRQSNRNILSTSIGRAGYNPLNREPIKTNTNTNNNR